MAITPENLQEKLDTLEADMNILHQIIHGDVSTVVTTEGGGVPSIAKQVHEMVLVGTGVKEVTEDYVLTQLDNNMLIRVNSASPVNIVIPDNVDWGGTWSVGVTRVGDGSVTIAGQPSVVLQSQGTKLFGKYTVSCIQYISLNLWQAYGDLYV